MKIIWLATGFVIAASLANGARKGTPDVVVFLHENNQKMGDIRMAEALAGRMLAQAGVSVSWRMGRPSNQGSAEVIEARLTNQPDDRIKPGALAYATLGQASGTRITIFYNRIRANGGDSVLAPGLAHVLAHEITHILEGVKRHSDSGVMKACWDLNDWRKLRHSPLPFADEDLRLLHDWIERRNRTLLAVR
jgi:hypothetical protein